MKTFILSVCSVSLISFAVSAAPAEQWYNKSSSGVKDTYAGFGIGGEFYAGDAYDDTDPRFRLQFEGAWKTWSFPLSLSFGDDAVVVGMNPRYQYWFHPFKGDFAKLGIAPAVGPTFGYTSYESGGLGYDAIDIGLGVSGVMKYDINRDFSVMFTPIGMNFSFFRALWYNSNMALFAGKDDDTSTDFGFVYAITLAGAYNF